MQPSSPHGLDLNNYPIPDGFWAGLSSHWAPPPKQGLAEWAEDNITLSSEYAARASRLKLFGWQREIFDTYTDPRVSETVLMVGTQLVKTLFIQCAIAHDIAVDPGPMLLTEPTADDAKTFSKERLAPMIRDNDCLRSVLGDSEDTLLTKVFPGGNLSIVGVGAPGNLARRSIRVLACDEIDKYVKSAGKEGSPVDLARARQDTFGSRKKTILCCSPTVSGDSAIETAYNNSDMRRPWVACPRCQEWQLLRWSQVKWDASLSRDAQPKSAYYECENPSCRAKWTEAQRKATANRAKWVAEKPFAGVAGFWISHLYSPWKSIPDIVKDFLSKKDIREKRQVFVNTVLAELWSESSEQLDAEKLYARRESYPFGAEAVVPRRALFLTAAVDVQPDSNPRLEVEVRAWGRNAENWSIDYKVLQVFDDRGEPRPITTKELWDRLRNEVLNATYLHESGHRLPITCMAIDTGNRPKPVYDFARRSSQLSYSPATGLKLHSLRTVVPIKGSSAPSADDRILAGVSKEDAIRRRQGVRIVMVGTHFAKQQIVDCLKNDKPDPDGSLSGRPVAGCYHFPEYGMQYFEGITAEAKTTIPATGKIEWKKIRDRNEPFDLAVYSRAMYSVVGGDRFKDSHWAEYEKRLSSPVLNSEASVLPEGGDSEKGHALNSEPSPSGTTQPTTPLSATTTSLPLGPKPPEPQKRQAIPNRYTGRIRGKFL